MNRVPAARCYGSRTMKKIVICGAGEVGKYAAEVFANQGHRVAVIDINVDKLNAVGNTVDATLVKGSSTHPNTLLDIGIENVDALIAATNSDEVNLLTAALGKRLGAQRVIARIHNRSLFESSQFSYTTEFGIDHLMCPEQFTSSLITSNLSDPGVSEIEHFAESEIETHRYVTQKGSSCLGMDLQGLGLPQGMRIAVVKRQGKSFIPEAATVLEQGDEVTLVGRQAHFDHVQKMFKRSAKKDKRVTVVGISSLTEWLVEDLLRHHFQIRVFETNKNKAIEFSEKYSDITIIQSDPSNPEEFEAEHLDDCPAFVAASDSDEYNILSALQAKQYNVETAIAIIHSPTFLRLLKNIGIDFPFSPRIVAAKRLTEILDDSPVKTITSLAPGVANIYRVGPTTEKISRKKLKDLSLPRGCFVTAIQRQGHVIVPISTDEIMVGDIVFVVGSPNIRKKLHKTFI